MTLYRRVVAAYHNAFNWKLALISAFFNGPAVLWFNLGHSPYEYLSAGGWQALLSAVSTGITGRVAQHFGELRHPIPAYSLGTAVPATMTFCFALAVHIANATPELLASCAWPTFVSLSSSLGLNFGARFLVHKPEWRWIKKFLLIEKRKFRP